MQTSWSIKSLTAFANETASESVAPGGGSVSAYVGALGVALGGMVANLSANRRVWDDRWENYSIWAEKAQALKSALLQLVDEDTQAFNKIIDAVRLPKATEDEKAARTAAIEAATLYATEVPLQTMIKSLEAFEILQEMADKGNPNSASDVGVGALCIRAAIRGAHLNVNINAKDLADKDQAQSLMNKAQQISEQAEELEAQILAKVGG